MSHIAIFVERPGADSRTPGWNAGGRYLGEFSTRAAAEAAGARFWQRAPGAVLDLERPGYDVEDIRFRPGRVA